MSQNIKKPNINTEMSYVECKFIYIKQDKIDVQHN
jgi:hypothetical protein